MLRTDEEISSGLLRIIRIRQSLSLDTSNLEMAEIVCSLSAGNFRVFPDVCGNDAGYIIWARINDFSLKRLTDFNIKPQYFHEWVEGENIFIIGLVSASRYSNMEFIKKELMQFDRFCYLNHNGKLVFRSKKDLPRCRS
jgi:hemolysin-activating ACP:hemolysin acyltransferase